MNSHTYSHTYSPHHTVPEINLCICLIPNPSNVVGPHLLICSTSLPHCSSLIYPQPLESTQDVLVLLGL